jgi:hypothetical protein
MNESINKRLRTGGNLDNKSDMALYNKKVKMPQDSLIRNVPNHNRLLKDFHIKIEIFNHTKYLQIP